jgi:SAM-dependent methyltransferase
VTAVDTNRRTYDALWPTFSDFIRYNPGARHRRRHVFALLDRLRFSSLLDVGCGNGELLSLIARRHPHVALAGVDLSPVVVEANQRAFPTMRFAVGNIETDDPGGVHDVVVACEVLEHLDQPEAALRRMATATRPGGHVILTTPTGRVHATERHFGHVRHPTPTALRLLADAADLDVVELLSWGFPTYALTKWATNLDPEAALARFGGDRAYGPAEKLVSTAAWLVNFANLPSSPLGVQLFALLRRRYPR